MTMQRRSTLCVLLAVVGIVLIRLVESQNRYTFGHPRWVDWAILGILGLLACTHVFIAVVMGLQRRTWRPAEAAMFRWISVKAILWADLATSFRFLERGVLLDIAYLYVLMIVFTVDMDIKMLNRYVRGKPGA